jgi:hypothetical protein
MENVWSNVIWKCVCGFEMPDGEYQVCKFDEAECFWCGRTVSAKNDARGEIRTYKSIQVLILTFLCGNVRYKERKQEACFKFPTL